MKSCTYGFTISAGKKFDDALNLVTQELKKLLCHLDTLWPSS